MLVKDLKKLLEKYSDDGIIQINIEDGYSVTTETNIFLDEDYDKKEALVIVCSLPDGVTVDNSID